jgi:hypothetical protein
LATPFRQIDHTSWQTCCSRPCARGLIRLAKRLGLEASAVSRGACNKSCDFTLPIADERSVDHARRDPKSPFFSQPGQATVVRQASGHPVLPPLWNCQLERRPVSKIGPKSQDLAFSVTNRLVSRSTSQTKGA